MDPTVSAIAADLGACDQPAEARAALLVPMLREVQARLGAVPTALLSDVASAAGVAESRAFAVATFYPAFGLSQPAGRGRVASADDLLADLVEVPVAAAPVISCRRPRHPAEERRVIARCRAIDPWRIEDYRANGGYTGLARARAIGPDAIVDVVARSGLRGRGGAGFPTARKWQFARETTTDRRYLVCNAAEGDLGATMDRAILQTDPHAVLEGMAIAAHAIGAAEAFLFVRAEYTSLLPLLREAIRQADEGGYLGDDLRIRVVHAAGRYICGEETALLNAMEGKPGRPRCRPPFPAHAGLWGKPTVVNNVKTLAAIPLILGHGPKWFASVGTERSPGTAVLALAGHIAEVGIVEVPMGIPLRRVIEDIGGGVSGGRPLKAVQTGGPLGGLIPTRLLDTPVTYEEMAAIGSPLGSGGMIAIAEGTCMVAVARGFAQLCAEESCGYCAPCRLGTARLARTLVAISEGRGTVADLDALWDASETMRQSSFCAFGQGAQGVVGSALAHFGAEFEEHVRTGRCPTGTCRRFARESA